MNSYLALIGALIALTACSTPQTVLRHSGTKQVVQCGGSANGSLAGGMIGYQIQKENDAKCVDDYKEQGFSVVKITE